MVTSPIERTPEDLGEDLEHVLQRLRAVLVARHGIQIGRDLHAELSAYAWEHRDRLRTMENPAGFLFRVSQSRARRYRRWGAAVDLPPEAVAELDPTPDTDLADALARLSPDDRTIAVLVHAYGYSYQDVADLLDMTVPAVRNRLHRSMSTLRRLLHQEENR